LKGKLDRGHYPPPEYRPGRSRVDDEWRDGGTARQVGATGRAAARERRPGGAREGRGLVARPAERGSDGDEELVLGKAGQVGLLGGGEGRIPAPISSFSSRLTSPKEVLHAATKEVLHAATHHPYRPHPGPMGLLEASISPPPGETSS
jgi:hypothetical protein